MKFKPTINRVVLKLDEPKTVTSGGIILTDSNMSLYSEATVLAIGPGVIENGQLVPVSVYVGDRVLILPAGKARMTIEGQECVMLFDSDILGVL